MNDLKKNFHKNNNEGPKITIGKVLLWLFFWWVMIFVVVWKSNLTTKVKIGATAGILVLFIIIGAMGSDETQMISNENNISESSTSISEKNIEKKIEEKPEIDEEIVKDLVTRDFINGLVKRSNGVITKIIQLDNNGYVITVVDDWYYLSYAEKQRFANTMQNIFNEFVKANYNEDRANIFIEDSAGNTVAVTKITGGIKIKQ